MNRTTSNNIVQYIISFQNNKLNLKREMRMMMYLEITKLLPIIVLIIGIAYLPLSLSSNSRGGYPFTFGREKLEYYKQRLQDNDHDHGISSGGGNSNKYYKVAAETNSFGLIMANKPSRNSLNIIFNVDDFGARGDGFSDDSQAFEKAWNYACSSSKNSIVLVPKKKNYRLKPITFSGPCRSAHITLKIQGTIKASPHPSDYDKDRLHWIIFQNIDNFSVDGGGTGTINGNGRIWWQNSCKVDISLPCKHAPTAVTFLECNDLIVANLRFRNAQQMHLTFQKCVNVQAMNLRVISPGNSPNTDGIHITDTQNIKLRNCVIRTGDDCISIVSGSKYVVATDITCGPGHGISIGSLGAANSEAQVSNVMVNRAKFSGTTNGLRIKTWQGGSGYAKNIKFQNIQMQNVSNPVIIDQNYCDQEEPCKEQESAVQISNVVYSNIVGTSASKVALNFNCSRHFPCQSILIQNVNLVREEDDNDDDQEGGGLQASCNNVSWYHRGRVSPSCSTI